MLSPKVKSAGPLKILMLRHGQCSRPLSKDSCLCPVDTKRNCSNFSMVSNMQDPVAVRNCAISYLDDLYIQN